MRSLLGIAWKSTSSSVSESLSIGSTLLSYAEKKRESLHLHALERFRRFAGRAWRHRLGFREY